MPSRQTAICRFKVPAALGGHRGNHCSSGHGLAHCLRATPSDLSALITPPEMGALRPRKPAVLAQRCDRHRRKAESTCAAAVDRMHSGASISTKNSLLKALATRFWVSWRVAAHRRHRSKYSQYRSRRQTRMSAIFHGGWPDYDHHPALVLQMIPVSSLVILVFIGYKLSTRTRSKNYTVGAKAKLAFT